MLNAEQVGRRVAREVASGATLRQLDALPRDAQCVVESEMGLGTQILSMAVTGDVRVVSVLGVFDFTKNLWRLREVPPGVSAAEIQARISVPLLCGPELSEVRVD